MFYNIKILSTDSEYSLESNNKEIVQREMDLYFAQIFGASEEFKSKIKKVKIVNTNLKSINLLNEPMPKKSYFSSKKEENNIKQIIESTPNEIENINNTTIKEKEIQTQDTKEKIEISSEVIEIEEISEIPTLNEDTTFTSNQKETIEVKPSNIESVADKPKNIEYKKEEINIIDEIPEDNLLINIQSSSKEDIAIANIGLETLAKEIEQEKKMENFKIEDIDSIKKEIAKEKEEQTIKFKNQNNKIAQEHILFKEEQKEENTIDDLIKTLEEKVYSCDITEKGLIEFGSSENRSAKLKPHKPIKEEHDVDIDADLKDKICIKKVKEKYIEENQSMLDDIFNTPQTPEPKQETKPKDTVLNLKDNIDDKVKNLQIELEDIRKKSQDFNPQDILDEALNKPLEASGYADVKKPDFRTYLKNFNSKNQLDDFLICAYYIKNIERENCFSMKSINSKLFPATGKIADMSILNQLIENDFILVETIENLTRYCISPQGEKYFTNLIG